MRSFDEDILALYDERRVVITGMIRVDLGEGAFGFIHSVDSYDFNGLTYAPIPRGIISISDYGATTGTTAAGFQVRVAENPDVGAPANSLMQIEDYDYREKPITCWNLHTHPDTGVRIGVEGTHEGYISHIEHTVDPDIGPIMVLHCETEAIELSKSNGRLRTDEDQARRSAGDLIYSNAGNSGREKVDWGRD